MDFVKITRMRAKVASTRRPLPLAGPTNVPAPSTRPAEKPRVTKEPNARKTLPSTTPASIPPAPETEDASGVRWEKVHAVKNAIASGHFDVEGRLIHLLARFADADLSS